MNYKSIGAFVITMCCIVTISTAQLKEQAIQFKNFENCIKKHLEKTQPNNQKLNLFYCSKYYPILIEKSKVDGKFYNLRSYKLEDSLSSFYKELSFDRYINFSLSHLGQSTPSINLDKGVWAYVNCSIENWEQFYLDLALKSKYAYLTVNIELFEIHENKIFHKRKILILKSKPNQEFMVHRQYYVKKNRLKPVKEKQL